MLTRFHRMILRLLPGPFVGWLTALMFLLLMQFLIRYMPELVGKGLPLLVVIELIAYSLAYMLVLAVPMSVLIATLMTFGRLAENGSYAVIKSAGVSFGQLVWPALIAGAFLAAGMGYFNTRVLPEANYRAATLWRDIKQKKPGFALQPGVFYEGVSKYSILVGDIDGDANSLTDITIFDYSRSRHRAEIKAERGTIVPNNDGTRIDLVLENGEMHQFLRDAREAGGERYERVQFAKHRLRLDLEDFSFERTDPSEGRRSDRTMATDQMGIIVDSLRLSVERSRSELRERALALPELADAAGHSEAPPASPEGVTEGGAARPGATQAVANPTRPRTREPSQDGQAASALAAAARDAEPAPETGRIAAAGLTYREGRNLFDRAAQKSRQFRTEIDNVGRAIKWKSQRADRYAVEIHKKYSIAVACLIFMLVGAPLGVRIRKGSLGVSGALAMGIFLFYWVTLVYGEKLADRDKLDPWVGMWIANIITGIGATWVTATVLQDRGSTPTPLARWRAWRKRRATGAMSVQPLPGGG